MRKKIWNIPTVTTLYSSSINSGTGTRNYYENILFTLDNTCTYNGVGCTTAEGITYVYVVPNVNNTATQAGVVTGVVATCTPGIQCS